ncbi:MAG: hypothetical protein GYB67_09150 [Chloroflexi bacterium]|nr:hypothetical protein [Chloroflexota bacterium]
MFLLRSYINPAERKEADRKLPRLMFEGLLLGGSGLGVLALIFEIAADAFSVAAYQTLLAIHGADGYHEIAILAFITLSVMLFLGIVPAYKAGSYLRPNAGGSGPLVEAIGPPRLRWLSWIGSSLFFIDAVLTIIISSISAADVTMLLFPEFVEYRILLAEFYAFFIMVVLVAVGPRNAVPLFLIGGGAFTLFTIVALTVVGASAAGNPEWSFLTEGIVTRLETAGVVEHVIRAQEDLSALGPVVFFQLFFRSMSSAMLGFSGYEVIPASGKHAARPKWKVINTALTLAAVFLIGTGVIQLYAAQQWNIPSTEGYSTLLIEYEIVAAQVLGGGIDPDQVVVTEDHVAEAEQIYEARAAEEAEFAIEEGPPEALPPEEREAEIQQLASSLALIGTIERAIGGTLGEGSLFVAGVLLATILLLAQGGGYVGGAAVAANAARLGRLPRFLLNDRLGIVVIWAFAALLVPIIREVVVVEAFYAFGFVSAFIITSTTVFLVKDAALRDRGIEPGSEEARSLKFAGLRGMIASYAMGIVLITQKTDALFAIAVAGTLITIYQIWYARGGFRAVPEKVKDFAYEPGGPMHYISGIQRAKDEARQRATASLINHLLDSGALTKFNVEHRNIQRLVCYMHNLRPEYFEQNGHEHSDRVPEPSEQLEQIYQGVHAQRDKIIGDIEYYSHYGIFTYIDKYYHNWVNYEHGRDPATVQKAMLNTLFPLTDKDEIWKQYKHYQWVKLPEPIWQFCRLRYQWAKAQWPNLSDRITTVWTLQDLGLIPDEVDVTMVVSVSAQRNDLRKVELHTHGPEENIEPAPTDTTPDREFSAGADVSPKKPEEHQDEDVQESEQDWRP